MNIVITGASGGVGDALIEQFATEGNTLFLHSYRKSKKKQSVHHWSHGDLTQEKTINTFAELINKHGGADVIIHAASFPIVLGEVLDKKWSDFDTHVQLQIKSLFLLAKHLVPSMKVKKFGRVISIATEYAIGRPPVKLADYVTAKYALVGLTKSLAVELGTFGITCNCISPGTMVTPMTNHLPRKLLEIIAAETPTKRLTTPLEVAQLAAFLSSPAASQITGENIAICGGNVME